MGEVRPDRRGGTEWQDAGRCVPQVDGHDGRRVSKAQGRGRFGATASLWIPSFRAFLCGGTAGSQAKGSLQERDSCGALKTSQWMVIRSRGRRSTLTWVFFVQSILG